MSFNKKYAIKYKNQYKYILYIKIEILGRDLVTEPYKVNLILLKIKLLIGEGKCSFEEQREKNMRTLAALGLLPEDVFEILMELTPQNYYRGPSTDYNTNEPDSIWEFGIILEGREIYIKLKLTADFVKDISFHFAEKPMEFPFKNLGGSVL